MTNTIKKHIEEASPEELIRMKQELSKEIDQGILKDSSRHSYTMELKDIEEQLDSLVQFKGHLQVKYL